MILTIEALDASEGDCLLLHHGDPGAPALVLVDGGPARTYNRALLPRLRQLRAARGDDREPLPIGLAVLSHIDDDHVAGLVKLFEALADAQAEHQPAIAAIAELWHNSFDDVIGNDQVDAAIAFLESRPVVDPHGKLAGTRQGRELTDLARRLRIALNAQFKRLVARPDDAAIVVDHGELRLTVLGPTEAELRAYQSHWDRDLKAGHIAAVDLDTSDFNLSSIMLLVESGGRTIILAGDGRGDHLLAGLVASGHLVGPDAAIHVDVFKLPHHGSVRNVTPELLRRVTADTYILSANGKHQNPDIATLDMLAEARGDAPYTLVCTFPEAAYRDADADTDAERRHALQAIDAWLRERPDNVTVRYRERNALGVRVDLGDEPAP
ncbi:MAG TPA: MBL fold metallo-hydrolase [Nannocystaceae bacterium]|nr:MBL fold metallo-hydrolase [Nannocystaceae bacterium]